MYQAHLLLQETNVLIHPNVLVKRGRVDGDVLLTHWLDEAHLRIALLQTAHESERRGCFADVLFRGGDEDRAGTLGGREEAAAQ